jgi:hypothetical protein
VAGRPLLGWLSRQPSEPAAHPFFFVPLARRCRVLVVCVIRRRFVAGIRDIRIRTLDPLTGSAPCERLSSPQNARLPRRERFYPSHRPAAE